MHLLLSSLIKVFLFFLFFHELFFIDCSLTKFEAVIVNLCFLFSKICVLAVFVLEHYFDFTSSEFFTLDLSFA